MKKIQKEELVSLEGGKNYFWAGATCALAVVSIGAAYTNPVTGTLASLVLGTYLGSTIGSCLGFIYTGK